MILGDNFCCLHQRRRHRGGADIGRPQHSWGIAPEPVISMNDMTQGISRHRVGQLGRSCHHTFEARPATRKFNGRFKGRAIRLGFQQGGTQIPERSQCLTQRGSGIRDTRVGQPLRIPPGLAKQAIVAPSVRATMAARSWVSITASAMAAFHSAAQAARIARRRSLVMSRNPSAK